MDNLTLFYSKTCPYCAKVLKFMKENNIQVPLKDRDAHPNNRIELIKIGGNSQVPCLIIGGEALYESDDIIAWMKSNLVKK